MLEHLMEEKRRLEKHKKNGTLPLHAKPEKVNKAYVSQVVHLTKMKVHCLALFKKKVDGMRASLKVSLARLEKPDDFAVLNWKSEPVVEEVLAIAHGHHDEELRHLSGNCVLFLAYSLLFC